MESIRLTRGLSFPSSSFPSTRVLTHQSMRIPPWPPHSLTAASSASLVIGHTSLFTRIKRLVGPRGKLSGGKLYNHASHLLSCLTCYSLVNRLA